MTRICHLVQSNCSHIVRVCDSVAARERLQLGAMASAQKRRKIEHKENVSTPARADSTWHDGRQDFKIQEAKIFAVAQAQQEGCLGSYRSFDSPFGNYLLPVIPTHAELFSGEDRIQTMKPGEVIGGMKQTKTSATAQMTQ